MNGAWLDRRPLALAIAGPNGAGKTTFYHAHVAASGLRIVNADRVAMRVSQGGHGVPADKLRDRFRRTLANLRSAITRVPHVVVFDNSDLARPYRLLASFENGVFVRSPALPAQREWPAWFRRVMAPR